MASGALVANITEDEHLAIDEDRPIRITVTSDGTATGTPVNMGSYALEFKLLKPDGTAAVTKTTAGGGIAVQDNLGTNDRAVITLSDTDKSGLAPGNGYSAYLRRTDAGNEYFLWVAERVVLKQYNPAGP